MKSTHKTRKAASAGAIARLADRGQDVSRFFTNKGQMMSPIQRVNLDLAPGMLEELDKAAEEMNISRQAVIKTLIRQALEDVYKRQAHFPKATLKASHQRPPNRPAELHPHEVEPDSVAVALVETAQPVQHRGSARFCAIKPDRHLRGFVHRVPRIQYVSEMVRCPEMCIRDSSRS